MDKAVSESYGLLNRAELASWSALAADSQRGSFAQAWLLLQAGQLQGARHGVMVMGDPDHGPFEPVAWYPAPNGASAAAILEDVVNQALQEGEAAVASQKGGTQIAYPLQVSGRLHGVVAFDVLGVSPETAVQSLRWGVGVVESWLLQSFERTDQDTVDRLMYVVNSVAKALQQGKSKDVALTLVTDLAVRLDCDRVSLGFRKGKRAEVLALSHSSRLVRNMNLVRALGEAMDEAIDQNTTLCFPIDESRTVQTRSHRALAREFGNGNILTVPFHPDDRARGALSFERPDGQPFEARDIELCQALVILVGRIIWQRHRQERPFWIRWKDRVALELGRLFGARYIGRKLLLLLLLAGLAFAWLAHGAYRIKADAVVQGVVQRSLMAPFDGYLSEVNHRAGDVVSQGSVLASLDTRDTALELLRADSLLVQYRKQVEEAMAKGDNAAAAIAQAQGRQAQAQIAYLRSQQERASIRAPFDGILVSGDLNQQLGEAVKRGQELFKISPMEGYQLWLQVENRSIAEISEGQIGEVALVAMPDQPIPFTIMRIVPLALVEDGKSVFRVEAKLDSKPAIVLRPGMEGIGRINIDQRRYLWIWTHGLMDWLRLKWWAWF